MQLLIFLVLAGTISGSISGAFLGRSDGVVLGGSSGLVMGVTVWLLTGVVMRVIREYRLNQYFTRDGNEQE